MKLFSPKETTFETQKKQDSYVTEIAYLERSLDIVRKRLNTENQAFETRLKEQKDLYSEEKQVLQEELKVLMNEVKALEARREEAMKPIATLKKENEALHKDLLKQLKKVSDKEYEVEDRLMELTKKIDDISERESIIETEEQKLAIRLKSTQEEALMVSNGHKGLNLKMANFYKELQEKTEDLIKKENTLNIKENMLSSNHEEEKTRLANLEKLLKDRRGALERFALEIGFNKQNK